MSGFRIGLQLLITLIPLLAGLLIGGGLGYLYASRIRKGIRAKFVLRRRLMLFPWRSVIAAVPFLAFFIPRPLGLGVISGAIIVACFVVLVTVPFSANTLLNSWFPLPLKIRLIALMRIIAVSSISVAAVSGIIGGFAASAQMIQAMQVLDYRSFFNVFYVVFTVALLVDVLIGVIQYTFYRSEQDWDQG